MLKTVRPICKAFGELRVPGEKLSAERALLLAAVSDGLSRIENSPPNIILLVNLLEKLGVEIRWENDVLNIVGRGLYGINVVDEVLPLADFGEIGLLILAILSGQNAHSRVDLGPDPIWAEEFLQILAAMGMPYYCEADRIYVIGNGMPCEYEHHLVGMKSEVKIALMVAGLFCSGKTKLREANNERSRVERLLLDRGVSIERKRSGGYSILSIEGGQHICGIDVDLPGDLSLTYPFLLPALALKGSHICVKYVAIRSGHRHFLDFLRQIGSEIELTELGDHNYNLHVRYSCLKPTRVAGKRAEKILPQLPLLAVLATQVPGEVVVRDIQSLRSESFDLIQHLFTSLRSLQVRIGEFPEGLVIKGGFPIIGGTLDARGNPDLIQAFSILGLWAEGQVEIKGFQGIEMVNPNFFDALNAIKEKN